jgi:Phosphodiester glycosidase
MIRDRYHRNMPKKNIWIYLIGVLAAFGMALFGVVVILPAASPATGAQAADLLRSVLGPQGVADIEGVSFRAKDVIYRFMSAHDGHKVQISLAQPTVIHQPPAARKLVPSSIAVQPPIQAAILPPAANVVSALPQIGWQPYGPLTDGVPLMAQALLQLDPQRPYAAIALVRIDLSRLQLHMMPGFLEPSHAASVVNAIPNLGMIPVADQSHLVAAFNGGFKAVNGHYGMMVDGVTLLPPMPGLATLALYRDGHVNIGAWDGGITQTPDLIAFRQNCPLIVQSGQINPMVNVVNYVMWGNTIGNQDITWRTGVGITQDSRYMIYAVGNGTSVATLAQALQQAGAYNAMQLDINQHYAHFAVYQPSGKPGNSLQAVQLLDQMQSDPNLYLTPHSRDYFYLTTY